MYSSISKVPLLAGESNRLFYLLVFIPSRSRPLLFRSTSAVPLRAWGPSNVPHPHGSVIAADSFLHGAIRSRTDYSVYAEAGLNGLDFAFYTGRGRYHTKYDSIPGMTGGKRSLWAMMESTHGASVALANRDDLHGQAGGLQDRPVFFDREHGSRLGA